ncbi:interleukin-1 receptor accessory protein isoform X3 [Castor canadensis]|uniref:Interleukin-1 receptor accessory protein isoform X3 n=1 Tax=Castor canadensis TaxID=51338 RepID=A0AC58MJP8_CASCN
MELLWFVMSLYFYGILQSDASERCDDWGLDTMRQIQVFEDEPARIKCPLFEHFLKFNYSTAHSAGLTLIWYWTRQDRDLEEPINFRLPENRISKEKDVLWFRPTLLNDTGNYTCMLRNTTYCSKVAFPLEVVQKDSCFKSPMKLPVHRLYIEYGIQRITCPNVDGFFPSNVKPAITWYKECSEIYNFHNVLPEGRNLSFLIPLVSNNGNYTCVVTYPENGHTFHLTRTLSVKVVGSPKDAIPPQIYSPNDRVVYEKEPGEELLIPCKVYFSFIMDSHNEIWWTIDGKKPDDIPIDITINESVSYSKTEDETRVQILSIKKVTLEDLRRNYVCHARNAKGEVDKAAKVKQKVVPPRYTVELACGFGATVFLVVILIVVYHVYWLEIVLFYRAHFGTDETILDGKEYDIYVSYARNAEEEEFVLLTLRGVLENEFGYKLCIFDRDSLPGGRDKTPEEPESRVIASNGLRRAHSSWALEGSDLLQQRRTTNHPFNKVLAGNRCKCRPCLALGVAPTRRKCLIACLGIVLIYELSNTHLEFGRAGAQLINNPNISVASNNKCYFLFIPSVQCRSLIFFCSFSSEL